ncbi:MAG TPA: hypothetical protein PLE45_05075 [Spirochaetota bacterium]|nr:hypothetical protein [Spirochaetota bacterium]HOL56623.1 hypothetical protein [Spirochaetota bacterium]HPP03736.1 hypothetical protein [Spirochaetota bacterium]
MNNLAILICSCDKYEDAWQPFFFFFKKFWGNCDIPIYLLTNFKKYNDDKIISLCIGEDIDWSTTFLHAIEKINKKYLLIFMEDYFLTEKVDFDFIKKSVIYMQENKISYFRLFPCPGPDNIIGNIDDIKIGEIMKNSPYRVSLQLAIWDIDYLKRLVKKGESAWEFEIRGTERTNNMDDRLISISRETRYPLKYLCTAIVKGYWKKEAVELCKKNGIKLDLKKRKIEPFYVRKDIKIIIKLVNLKNKIKKRLKKIFSKK